MKKETFKITPSRKYKMDKEELEMHLHLKRKGASITKDKSKYHRKPKHVKSKQI